MFLIPKNYFSWFCGFLFGLKLGKPLSNISINIYCRITGADPSEAELPVSDYSSIRNFFVRRLKPGIRPIDGDVVSPVDGKLRNWEYLSHRSYLQVKGKRYSLASLIGTDSGLERFEGGAFMNLYLAPSDYHRIHAPLDCDIIGYRYLPGKLWPVNDWSLRSISNLFGVNERVVIYLKHGDFLCLMVLVGATNVGKIELVFDDLKTNQLGLSGKASKYVNIVDRNISLKCGDEMAVFNLGSSVLLFFEKGSIQPDQDSLGTPGSNIKMGAKVASLTRG